MISETSNENNSGRQPFAYEAAFVNEGIERNGKFTAKNPPPTHIQIRCSNDPWDRQIFELDVTRTEKEKYLRYSKALFDDRITYIDVEVDFTTADAV